MNRDETTQRVLAENAGAFHEAQRHMRDAKPYATGPDKLLHGKPPIMLEMAAADDEQRKWEQRWNLLIQLYGHDRHRTDEDGRWCLRDFLEYAGSVCGFARQESGK